MNNNSDSDYNRFADFDFSEAVPVSQIPALAKLQAELGHKSRITTRVDNDILAIFKARAEMCDGSYQSLMNDALKQFAQGLTSSDMLRETIKEELRKAV